MTPWFFYLFSPKPTNAAPSSYPFQVRAATVADLTPISQIIAQSFHSQKGFWGWFFPFMRLGIYEDLRHRLASPAPHHVCLVAIDTTPGANNALVGTVEIALRFNDWTQINKSFPYLSNLAVHPQYRRQGAASVLLKACEQITHDWGFQDLYLHVLENNSQARQLYFKQGYRVHKVESTWQNFIWRNSRQILLHKHLLKR